MPWMLSINHELRTRQLPPGWPALLQWRMQLCWQPQLRLLRCVVLASQLQ